LAVSNFGLRLTRLGSPHSGPGPSGLWGQALIICFSDCGIRNVESSKFGTPRGYPNAEPFIISDCGLRISNLNRHQAPNTQPRYIGTLVRFPREMRGAECGILRMRNAECGVRNEHQGQRRTKVRGYEWTAPMRNAEFGMRNGQQRQKAYEGTNGLLQCGMRSSECGQTCDVRGANGIRQKMSAILLAHRLTRFELHRLTEPLRALTSAQAFRILQTRRASDHS